MRPKVSVSSSLTQARAKFFVHVSGLVDKVRENDNVSYEVEQGRKGLNAVNVRVI
jgi:CspA family cold shock protein